jgi:hypothetical protein
MDNLASRGCRALRFPLRTNARPTRQSLVTDVLRNRRARLIRCRESTGEPVFEAQEPKATGRAPPETARRGRERGFHRRGEQPGNRSTRPSARPPRSGSDTTRSETKDVGEPASLDEADDLTGWTQSGIGQRVSWGLSRKASAGRFRGAHWARVGIVQFGPKLCPAVYGALPAWTTLMTARGPIIGVAAVTAVLLLTTLASSARAGSAMGGTRLTGGAPGTAVWSLTCDSITGNLNPTGGSVSWSWTENGTTIPGAGYSGNCGSGGTSTIPANATGITVGVLLSPVCFTSSLPHSGCSGGSKTVSKTVDPAKSFSIQFSVTGKGTYFTGMPSIASYNAKATFALDYTA